MALDREHAWAVVQPFRDILADALERCTAATLRRIRLVPQHGAGQVRRQRSTTGRARRIGLCIGRTALTQGLEFSLDGGQVGVDGFVEQAGLLLVGQAFAAGSELEPAQHGDLVRELVDLGLTELEFLILGFDDGVLLGQLIEQSCSQLLQLEMTESIQIDRFRHGCNYTSGQPRIADAIAPSDSQLMQ